MCLQQGPFHVDVQRDFAERCWPHEDGALAAVTVSGTATGSVAHPLRATDHGCLVRPDAAPCVASTWRGWPHGCSVVCS
jgi:hypothetical protein